MNEPTYQHCDICKTDVKLLRTHKVSAMHLMNEAREVYGVVVRPCEIKTKRRGIYYLDWEGIKKNNPNVYIPDGRADP